MSMSGVVSQRHIASYKTKIEEPPAGTICNNEADTNADTCCLGSNFLILNMTTRTADVYPYDDSYAPVANVPIVSGATAWTDPHDNITYILVFHESLYYGNKLKHSLINPNQLRHNGIDFWDNPYDRNNGLSISIDRGPTLPMKYEGTKLIFETHVPSNDELNNCTHIEMTSILPWEPREVKLGKVQTKKNNTNVRFCSKVQTMPCYDHPESYAEKSIYAYEHDIITDEAIIHEIEPSLVMAKERFLQAMDRKNNEMTQELIPARRTFTSTERHNKLNSDMISELWCIGPRKAKETLKATTQYGIRSAILPLSRRYRADRMYNLKRLNNKFATDTLYATTKSLNQNICAQVYSHKGGFAVTYPIRDSTGKTLGQTLADFAHDFGIPEILVFDGAMAQQGKNTLFMKNVRKYYIKHHISNPRRPNENPAESAIREIKKRWFRIMVKRRVPRRLWDYGLVWICETGNLTVSSSRYGNGRTPIEFITGETPDIIEYLDFSFYDWAVYRANAGLGESSLSRWLGVSHKVGQLMSYWVLTISGHVISVTTIQRLTFIEKTTDEWKKRMNDYDNAIELRMDAKNTLINVAPDIPEWNRLSLEDNDKEFAEEFNKVISNNDLKDIDDMKTTEVESDPYLRMEIGLPRGSDNELEHATVKRRALDVDGKPYGTPNNNPLLDSRRYEVEFIDGSIEVLTANIIAENILAQVNEEGHRQLLLDEIIDHRTTKNCIKKEDGFIMTRSGQKRPKLTTRGWELCVQWKDGSTNWIALKDLKDSYPLELADYAIDNKLQDEPAFAWWVHYTRKKRTAIIAKVKSKYWQRTHKYGIRVPKTIKEAYEIDEEEGNLLWHNAVSDEMKKIRQAFEKYDGKVEDLIGYQKITAHFIFDIKLGEKFRRKARYVGDGHKTETPKSVTFSTVVARDSVRICLLIAALNELDVQAADIENAYLTAPCREKCWTIGGQEFGSEEGSVFIIRKALYGLKSSGAAFRAFLAETLDDIGFKSSIADPDVWLRPAIKPDGEQYYEYILVYVDDILSISHDAKEPMRAIQRAFKFKNDTIEPPKMYLGATLEEKQLNGKKIWTMSSKDYIKAAITNVELSAAKRGIKLSNKAYTPMMSGYTPDLDDSEELNPDDITYFQELIGMLRWAIEIGRVDILFEVSMLSSYQASPRRGHLEQILHIYAYLKKKPKITLYFDPSTPILDPSMFNGSTPEAFQEIYRDAKEEIPRDMPTARGRMVTVTAFVDASHAADKRTRRSHTGFVLFANKAPIIWYSKRQTTVESSTFSSEFIAMKTCMEQIIGLRYKLRMFGIPIDGPADVLCDNQSVVTNSSKLESALNKKHSSVAYHAVRWAVAASIIKVGKVHTDENLADPMTKRLTVTKRDYLFGNWTY